VKLINTLRRYLVFGVFFHWPMWASGRPCSLFIATGGKPSTALFNFLHMPMVERAHLCELSELPFSHLRRFKLLKMLTGISADLSYEAEVERYLHTRENRAF
jgi:hypothetical protein